LSKTLTTKLYLKQNLSGLKMQEGLDLAENINIFNQRITYLGHLDVKIDDEDKAIILLCSLPPSYEQRIMTLTFGKGSIKIEDITIVLLAQEQRRKNNAVEEPQAIGLLVKGESVKKKVEVKSKKEKVQCFERKEWGHMRKECPTNLKGSSANMVTSKSDSDSDGDVLSIAIERQPTKDWLLDSATSFHTTHKREWFSSYKSG
jgi:hypothetical protein